MTQLQQVLIFLGGSTSFIKKTLSEGFKRPIYFNLIIEQVYYTGVRSLPLVLIVTASCGMVMALQFGVGLEKFGGKLYVPKIVTLSIVRELGPVFAGLMMAARIGAGITSEVGSMKVTQQIDAIRALGTSPIKRIVFPRLAACMITIPMATVIATFIGVIGGLVVGSTELGLDPWFYIQKSLSTIKINDYFSGFGKTFFFAFFIGITSCYYGMNASGGTQGVGDATTKSVVTSCVFIVLGDYFLTKFFMVL